MSGRLHGKHAIVTGAGSGIGRATAELFATEGASVALIDANLTRADRVARAITETGGVALALQADVSVSSEVQRAGA